MKLARLLPALGLLLSSGLHADAAHQEVRIASPWPAQNAIIAMLGYGENIVGTSAIAKQIPLFRQSFPAIDKVPVISFGSGRELNPEQIIALRANLLILPGGDAPPGTAVAQQALLEQAGVKVVTFKANAMQALTDRVAKTAALLGPDAERRAQRYRQYFDRNVARVAERLKDLPAGQRVRVYHSMGSPLMTSGRPSLNQDWMDLAGAQNVSERWFDDKPARSGEVSLEKVVAANPAVIVAMNRRDADAIMTSPQWASVDAVRHRRVYVNPKGMFWWCRETSEEALQFLWLAKMLYPQRFADIDMRQETREFYRQFFGIALSEAQIRDVLDPPR
ncbi:ABC transporter substrate-binding protein [Pluralibacter gergoviae]|uniref:ABC transporter substrate-binding protein n=1 Tax=Pluralibacter gergoviae TaxID=61647 RepID=UPI0006515D43|nr:ABC transporter substrate-binding protein [Pluralibacter gergoviae]EKV0928193.1 ABC transporter substrate-binding protein [Pluralibacter gergoviae]EKV6246123.1 ABC transporter substrate-binding protein [Pluralibacter gergoviae]EKW9964334.1 ABC transporter substrate-binding protein [Pluralibacter gergoviae]ELD4269455.1 ABC transporter substrate-binding protein [Pluralibacter gergoviae]ELD4275660.1 ABC transporter substrate-binding protein [Pluralibacter gergoviae]